MTLLDPGRHMDRHDQERTAAFYQDRGAGIAARLIAIVAREPAVSASARQFSCLVRMCALFWLPERQLPLGWYLACPAAVDSDGRFGGEVDVGGYVSIGLLSK